jgi:hypothetical protein
VGRHGDRPGFDPWSLALVVADQRRSVVDPKLAGIAASVPPTPKAARPIEQTAGGVADWKPPVRGAGHEGSNPSFIAERTSDRAFPIFDNDRCSAETLGGSAYDPQLRNHVSISQARCAAAGRWSGRPYLCYVAGPPDS